MKSTLRTQPAMKALGDILFSRRCRICADFFNAGSSNWLCVDCLAELRPSKSGSSCETCGKPLYLDFDSPSYRCGDCLSNPPPYEILRSHGAYDGPLKEVIHQFKYQRLPGLGDDLAGLLMGLMKRTGFPMDFSAVLYVPLHRKKLLERGFDPAYLLAAKLAGGFHRPLLTALVKIRATPPQVSLSKKERLKNLKGAFSVTSENNFIKGNKVLLVDDVFTTGATLRECAAVLGSNGAKGIYCVTVARA